MAVKDEDTLQCWNKREVARRGSVSVRTVSEWMLRGLPYLKLSGRQVRFLSTDVEKFFSKHRIAGAGK